MNRVFLLGCLILILSITTVAQSFSSGSTGADGALDLASLGSPYYLQLPESGILNFTMVNVPAGKTLYFKPNFRNTPVYMLVQGNAT
jgi:hypothetical protein